MSPVTLWGTEVQRFKSEVVDQEFELQLAVMAPSDDTAAVPVVYLMDANITFAAVHQIVGLLQMSQQLPSLCLVGVGYPFDTPVPSNPAARAEWIRLRARDLLSATVDPNVLPHRVLETWGGGADAFLSCLEQEVEPRVSNLVAVDASRRTVVGHSGGGHFALYAGLTRPDFFTKVLAASPSLLNYEGLASLVEPWADKLPASGQHIFLSAGEPEREQLVAEAYMMAGSLRQAAPNATIDTFIMPGETHLAVWPELYVRGLTQLLGES